MTQVAIVADTLSRARQLATTLAEDDRFEIVAVRSGLSADIRSEVTIAIGLSSAVTSQLRSPVVLLSDGAANLGRNIRAVLPMSASAAEIGAAIQAATHDLTVLTPDQVLRWVTTTSTDDEDFFEELTARELQVLRMMADGSGNKDIAVALGISEHTVKFHVAQILGKLNASSRTEAVSLGIRRGLVAI